MVLSAINIINVCSERRANTALQLTASRARSFVFEGSLSSALAATERQSVGRILDETCLDHKLLFLVLRQKNALLPRRNESNVGSRPVVPRDTVNAVSTLRGTSARCADVVLFNAWYTPA